ncbi:hypothetical protein C0991_011473, partial [Blastosporella zonata]
FVDRDMIMQFRSGGVGHKSLRDATNAFISDRHPSDQCHDRATTPDNASDDNEEAAAQLNGVTFEEEEDYGYNDPMGQETDEENDVDVDEWDKGVELDILGPEDGDEGTQSMEDHLGYAEF